MKVAQVLDWGRERDTVVDELPKIVGRGRGFDPDYDGLPLHQRIVDRALKGAGKWVKVFEATEEDLPVSQKATKLTGFARRVVAGRAAQNRLNGKSKLVFAVRQGALFMRVVKK